MNTIVFSLFLMLYIAASILAYFKFFCRERPETAFFSLMVSLAILPFGLAFAFLLRRSAKPDAEKKPEEKYDLVISPVGADMEKYRAPMSEALVLNDHVVCCTLLLDALKNDPAKHIFGVREALSKGDPETAHYAAAAIMEMQRVMLNRVRQLGQIYQSGAHDESELNAYVDALKESLESKLFDGYIEDRLAASLDEVLDYMLEVKTSPAAYSNKTKLAIYRNNYAEALQYAAAFLTLYPNEEDAYLYNICCLANLRDIERLQIFVNELKHYPVKLTTKTLQYIRYLRDNGIVA